VSTVNPADSVQRWAVDKLIPYARNARTHSDEQIAQIAASIKQWGVTNPPLIRADGVIIAGHGRVLAARRLGLQELPVLVAEGWTESQIRAYVIADNKLALNAEWDADLLKLEVTDLMAAQFDMTLAGFSNAELQAFTDPEALARDMGEMGDMEYRVIVDCDSEQHQAQLLERFNEQGLTCRALIS